MVAHTTNKPKVTPLVPLATKSTSTNPLNRKFRRKSTDYPKRPKRAHGRLCLTIFLIDFFFQIQIIQMQFRSAVNFYFSTKIQFKFGHHSMVDDAVNYVTAFVPRAWLRVQLGNFATQRNENRGELDRLDQNHRSRNRDVQRQFNNIHIIFHLF